MQAATKIHLTWTTTCSSRHVKITEAVQGPNHRTRDRVCSRRVLSYIYARLLPNRHSVAWVAPTISSRATKILNKEPAYGCLKIMILVTIASMPTSSEGMTEFPAYFALLKWKRVLTLTPGKKFLLLTSTLLEIRNSNKLSFETCESNFEYLLTLSGVLTLSINGLLRKGALSPNFLF